MAPPRLQNLNTNEEQIREGIRLIKELATTREPNYELPADSFLSEVVSRIILTERARCTKLFLQLEALADECRNEKRELPSSTFSYVYTDMKLGASPDNSTLQVRSGIR